MISDSVPSQRLAGLLLDILLPALAYFGVARLSLLLAIAPSEAAAVWPPAGIAVAVVILRGRRAALGVFAGALATYLVSWVDTSSAGAILSSLLLILLLSVGPTLQALLVARLMRRYSQPNLALISEGAILRFLFLCAPLGCLTAASLSMMVFFVFGIAPADDFLLNWFTWWVGDCIGVMTVTPLLLVVLQKSARARHNRRVSVGVPMAVLLGIVIVLFYYSQQRDQRLVQQQFESLAYRQHTDLVTALDQSLETVYSLKHLFEGSDRVSAREFDHVARGILSRNPHLQALEWIPRVRAAERGAFERDAESPLRISEVDPAGGVRVAGERAEYFPVKYVVPRLGNEAVLGFDVASNPQARLAQQAAARDDTAVATRPIRLVQNSEGQVGVVVYLPVLRGAELAGLVATVIRTGDFIDSVLRRSAEWQFGGVSRLRIDDVTGGGSRSVYDNLADGPATGPVLERQLFFCQREWRVRYAAADGVLAAGRWSSMVLLFAGMLFTALFGGWLLTLTGRTMQVTMEVDRRTRELRREVAEREQVQKELSKLSLAVQHSPSMVLITDPAGVIEYINPKFTEVSGYELPELRGRNANVLFEADQGPGYYVEMIRQLDSVEEWKGEARSRKKNGDGYWAQMSLAPIFDGEGLLSHVVSVHQDITETKFIQEKISYQASHDLLTGLINRYEFERQLQRLIDQQRVMQNCHAYCFCDLDQFKVVNDTSGHAAGDALLKQVAMLLQSNLRKGDILARLGGDEFGILMENCTLEEAETVAHKILAELEDFRFMWGDSVHALGVSIGVVAIDDNCHDITEVLKNADSACYTAKDAGRNRVHSYTLNDELLAKREGEISWIGEINSALEEDRFELYGQMIVPVLDPGLKPGIEVLIRLRRGGDTIMPGAFLPAAERYGLSPRVDRWVVREAFAWLAAHPHAGEVIDSLAINLSGHSLGDGKLLEFICQKLGEGDIDPALVKFEITETSAIANLAESRKFIDAVKAHGCGFSLDDFGSGLSSFAYLKNLAVDYLKIDGMFVKDIAEDPIDRAMVKSINEIGKVMNKKTIAEFVENDQVMEELRRIGVDYAQGYGIGRPQPLAELLRDLSPADTALAPG